MDLEERKNFTVQQTSTRTSSHRVVKTGIFIHYELSVGLKSIYLYFEILICTDACCIVFVRSVYTVAVSITH